MVAAPVIAVPAADEPARHCVTALMFRRSPLQLVVIPRSARHGMRRAAPGPRSTCPRRGHASRRIAPSSMRTRRSALAITFWSCVEKMNVVPSVRLIVLHQLEDSLAGRLIEVRGRLVGEHDLRAGSPARARSRRAGAARRTAGSAGGARMRESCTTSRKWATRCLALLPRQLRELQQRILDVLLRGQHREQVERLEDEADGARAQVGELVGRLRRSRPRSSMQIRPLVGVSMQPIRLSSVDLPLPDGPAMARNTPGSIAS